MTQKKRAILKKAEALAETYEDAVRVETKRLQDFMCATPVYGRWTRLGLDI